MYELKDIKPFKGWDKSSAYLLMINPQEIPHLVFVNAGKYYSLTYFGTEIREDFSTYFQQLKRLNKKMIFVELDISMNQDKVYQIFCEYDRAGDNENSCLAPIKQLIMPTSKAEMIFQLIPELYDNQLIKSTTHIGLEKAVDKSGSFKLSTYNKEDIFSYIQLLKEKHDKRQKSQSKSS